MTPYRMLWAVLVSATLVLPGARVASAQTLNAPPAQSPSGPSSARKGFIVGIGVGGALHRIPEGRVTGDSLDRSAFAVGTDFKIGSAPTDQFLIYDSAKAAFTQDTDYDAVGMSGFGVTYMTRSTSPSFFVTGIAGESARHGREPRLGRGAGAWSGRGPSQLSSAAAIGDTTAARDRLNMNMAKWLTSVGAIGAGQEAPAPTRRDSVLNGLLIGAGVGALAGLIPDHYDDCEECHDSLYASIGVGAGVGLLVDALR